MFFLKTYIILVFVMESSVTGTLVVEASSIATCWVATSIVNERTIVWHGLLVGRPVITLFFTLALFVLENYKKVIQKN